MGEACHIMFLLTHAVKQHKGKNFNHYFHKDCTSHVKLNHLKSPHYIIQKEN